MKDEITWNDLTPEAQNRLRPLVCENTRESGWPVAILQMDGEPEKETKPFKRRWNIWVLSEGDIEDTLRQKGIKRKLTDDEIEEVARGFQKSVETLLGSGYSWREILRDAIDNTI